MSAVGASRLLNKRHSTGLMPEGASISRTLMQVISIVPVLPADMLTRYAQSCCLTSRAFLPSRAGIVKTIPPSDSP